MEVRFGETEIDEMCELRFTYHSDAVIHKSERYWARRMEERLFVICCCLRLFVVCCLRLFVCCNPTLVDREIFKFTSNDVVIHDGAGYHPPIEHVDDCRDVKTGRFDPSRTKCPDIAIGGGRGGGGAS